MIDRLEASLQELEARMLIPPGEIDVFFVKLEYLVSNPCNVRDKEEDESSNMTLFDLR